jgi:hypothetical protein
MSNELSTDGVGSGRGGGTAGASLATVGPPRGPRRRSLASVVVDPERHRKDRNISIRATSEYLDWLGRVAVAVRLPVPILVDLALAELAARKGLEQPPPR